MTTDTLRHLSILSGFERAKVFSNPYPYIVIENALPTELYRSLEASFPSVELVTDGREERDTWYEYSACKVVKDQRLTEQWHNFFRYHVSGAFFDELVEKLGAQIRALHPDLEKRVGKSLEEFAVGMRPGGRGDPIAPGADISMECQFYVNLTRAPRVVRGPHVDRPSELFAALLYFRHEDDDCKGGDLEVDEALSPELFPGPAKIRIDKLPMEVSRTKVRATNVVKYAPNTLVLFLNSANSIHAVTQRTPTPIPRRHINFCGDINTDLFSLERPLRLELKQRLSTVPGAWRIAKYL